MRDRNLKVRILSALALAPPVVVCIIAGTPFFEFLLLIAAIIMSVEWSRMADIGRFQHVGWSITSAVTAALFSYWGLSLPVGWTAISALIAVWPVALLAWSRRCKYPLWLAAGIPVIVLPTVALGWLRTALEGGMLLVLWLMMVVWATDIGAYASGRTIGGPKLAPRISPNKTWAGLGGGMAWAGLVGLGFALVLGAPAPRLAAISALLAVLAQAGDLAESAVKRHFHIKDSGTLIPGHGGLLDRVDGLLTVAPAVLVLAWLTGDPLLP